MPVSKKIIFLASSKKLYGFIKCIGKCVDRKDVKYNNKLATYHPFIRRNKQ